MASKRDKKRLEHLLKRTDNERRRLYKRAAQMRKAARDPEHGSKHKPDWSEIDDWEADDLPERVQKGRRRRAGSLHEWAEQIAVDEDRLGAAHAGEQLDEAPLDEGIVLGASSGQCRVGLDDGRQLDCLLPPELAAFQRSELAVGDRVRVGVASEGTRIVAEVVARRTTLSRHDSGPGGTHVERVIAANVDLVVVVAAVASPPLRTGLVDRYLVAIEQGGAEAIIALNKIDLLESDAALHALLHELARYAALDVPIVTCSSVDGRGVETLRAMLRGATSVFVGQSGVGKSSLLNQLDPGLAIATQDVGTARKGRHTTTASSLHRLPGDIRIIDTPGIREFGLWDVTRADLPRYFHEFDEHTSGCHFADCSHVHEPHCAVQRAVQRGVVAQSRYESYVRILASLD